MLALNRGVLSRYPMRSFSAVRLVFGIMIARPKRFSVGSQLREFDKLETDPMAHVETKDWVWNTNERDGINEPLTNSLDQTLRHRTNGPE